MRVILIAAASLALIAGCAPKKPPIDPANVRVYVPEPTGKNKKPGCQGTCQVTNPEVLTPAAADIMLAKVMAMPVGTDSLELDTLLFHDHETLHRLDAKSAPNGATSQSTPLPNSAEWESFIRKELQRKDVTVTIRVVDATGAERATIVEQWVIGEKGHHLVTEVVGVPAFEASGTLVRVGREHLWVRM